MPLQRADHSHPRNSMRPHDIVAKLWHLCSILRESGITYPEYVTELTYLLFLRMAEETGSENRLPVGCRWSDLASQSGTKQFNSYKTILRKLASGTQGRIREIFAEAETALTSPAHLNLLVSGFAQIDWYAAREEAVLADVYEGLLEKNSIESKAGAGQYFTPRSVIDAMVEVTKPAPGEIIEDPACGTAGFLIAADRYIKRNSKNFSSLTKPQISFQKNRAFIGVELVPKTHRLALMNAMLHGIYSPIILGDTLAAAGKSLPPADVVLTNPPFGTKRGGGLPTRTDFKWRVSNKQLCFLQHIYQGLRPGGRAAVVMPDLQGGATAEVCADLMEKCRLHTILRLPTGIFYAAGVRTNVLFFVRGHTDTNNTKQTWVYDLRSNMPLFGRRTPLTEAHLQEFVTAYGHDPLGNSPRKTGDRFRCFSRDEIRARGDNLDLGWLPEEHEGPHAEPKELLSSVLKHLKTALAEIDHLEKKLLR